MWSSAGAESIIWRKLRLWSSTEMWSFSAKVEIVHLRKRAGELPSLPISSPQKWQPYGSVESEQGLFRYRLNRSTRRELPRPLVSGRSRRPQSRDRNPRPFRRLTCNDDYGTAQLLLFRICRRSRPLIYRISTIVYCSVPLRFKGFSKERWKAYYIFLLVRHP